jgi:hypothetical protein
MSSALSAFWYWFMFMKAIATRGKTATVAIPNTATFQMRL